MKYIKEYNSTSFRKLGYHDRPITDGYFKKELQPFTKIEIDQIKVTGYTTNPVSEKLLRIIPEKYTGIINQFNWIEGAISIEKYTDEYYLVTDSNIFKYWCDQIDGLLDCLKEITKDYLTIRESLTQLQNSEIELKGFSLVNPNDYIIGKEEYEDFNNREISILKTIKNYNLDIMGEEDENHSINLYTRDFTTYPTLNIKKHIDGYFILYIPKDKSFYVCDQIEGLVNCIQEVINKKGKINESTNNFKEIPIEEYRRDKEIPQIIDPKDVEYIQINTRFKPSIAVATKTYIHIYDVVKGPGEFGNRNAYIRSYSDNWYVINLTPTELPHGIGPTCYLCDQIEGVVDCLNYLDSLNSI